MYICYYIFIQKNQILKLFLLPHQFFILNSWLWMILMIMVKRPNKDIILVTKQDINDLLKSFEKSDSHVSIWKGKPCVGFKSEIVTTARNDNCILQLQHHYIQMGNHPLATERATPCFCCVTATLHCGGRQDN